jgi:hypothetical protein
VKRALVVALLAGCIDVPPAAPTCDPGEDNDGDGWPCSGVLADCDDGNALVSPGKDDVPGEDRDCDGMLGNPGEVPRIGLSDGVPSVRTGDLTIDMSQEVFSQLYDFEQIPMLSDSAEERGVGLAVYPETSRGRPGHDVGGSIRDSSPVAVRLIEETTADVGGIATLTGVTYWWIYPRGRVVRHDAVTLSAALPAGSERFVSSYVSLNGQRFDTLHADGRADIAIPTSPTSTTFPVEYEAAADGWACAHDGEFVNDVGVTWLDRGGAGPRVTFGADGRLAFEYDWYRAESGTIPADPLEAVTIIDWYNRASIDDQGCDEFPHIADRYLDPARISVRSPGQPMGDIGDDAYDETAGFYAIDSGASSFVEVTFDEEAQDVFFKVDVQDPREAGLTVWRDGERLHRGIDFTMGPDGPGWMSGGVTGVLLWFPGELPAGTVLRIASPGGEPGAMP